MEDISGLIWHPWFVHLVVVESRHRMKPAQCLAVFPVAALLLGLPICGFGGVLPMDNPRTAELSSMTRVVSMRQRMVCGSCRREPRLPGWAGGLWWPECRWRRSRVERVLFAVVNPGAAGEMSGLTPAHFATGQRLRARRGRSKREV